MSIIVPDISRTGVCVEVEGVTQILAAISKTGWANRREHIEHILLETAWAIVAPAYDKAPDNVTDPGAAVVAWSQRAAESLEAILSQVEGL